METEFYITITLQTHNGPETFAKFFIGSDRLRALEIFKQLRGSRSAGENNIIFFDLVEMEKRLPVNLDLITCTLNELAENCRIITKELFISENFETS